MPTIIDKSKKTSSGKRDYDHIKHYVTLILWAIAVIVGAILLVDIILGLILLLGSAILINKYYKEKN